MQAPEQHNNSLQNDLEKKVELQQELSEAWRLLLGLEAQAIPAPPSLEGLNAIEANNQEVVPLLNHDPWRSLASEQGIQIVDLQQAHVHTAQADGEESDVEHALDMMQEQEKKPER